MGQKTSRFSKIGFVGPGYYISYEISTADGYLASLIHVIICKADSNIDRNRGRGACEKAPRLYKKGSVLGHEPGTSGKTATTAGVGGFTHVVGRKCTK
jgi:hypothetical protein